MVICIRWVIWGKVADGVVNLGEASSWRCMLERGEPDVVIHLGKGSRWYWREGEKKPGCVVYMLEMMW